MSLFDKAAPISAQPALLTAIKFSPQYSAISVEGKDVDSIGLGVLLSTVERLSENCGESMALGKLNAFYSFSHGRSFTLEKHEDSIAFKHIADVSRWSDLGAGFPNYTQEDFPDIPTRQEITQFLNEESNVVCFGFRSLSSQDWEYHMKSLGEKAQRFQSAGMVAMQIHVLLKSSQYPHGRMCLRFDNGVQWIWSTHDDRHCMLFVDTEISQASLGTVIHCGESFVLS